MHSETSGGPGIRPARAGQRRVALRNHRRVVGGSSGWARAPTKSVKFPVASSPRSGHISPNYSLKRTVQSLRDWSCRLAHALGAVF